VERTARAPDTPLAASTRLAGAAARIGASPLAEAAVLLSLGALSSVLTMAVDFDLRVPGHAILRAVFPLALGLALVPRRNAGFVAGLGALGGVFLAGGRGAPLGAGAMASLVLTGPLLDLAVRRARSGRGVYLGLVLGGVGANLLAFGARLAVKMAGEPGKRPLATWWPEALVTYALCGAVAGLVGAAVWFRFREREGGSGGGA